MFRNKPRIQTETQLCSDSLHELGQVTSPVSASVSSSVKWKGDHASLTGSLQGLNKAEHKAGPQRLPGTVLFFYTKSQFMRVRFDVSREAGSLPRAGPTPSSCFQVAQLNECL